MTKFGWKVGSESWKKEEKSEKVKKKPKMTFFDPTFIDFEQF